MKSTQEWLENYLRPVISNCYSALRIKGKLVLHISSKLSEICKAELNFKFSFCTSFNIMNKYSPFYKIARERINEVILVMKKYN